MFRNGILLGKKRLLQRVHSPKSRPEKEFPRRLALLSDLDDDDDDDGV
jgi:hypothetical protein